MRTKTIPKRIPQNAPQIVRGIVTADCRRFIEIKGYLGSILIDMIELITKEQESRAKIVNATGCALMSAAAINNFKSQVEEWTEFEPGIIVDLAGWNGKLFICGDASVIPAEHADEVDEVAYPGIPKFKPSGTLAEWQAEADRFLNGQPVPFFLCAYALAGPILRFVPSDVLNPQMELVGDPKTGKSSVGAYAASVWGGNPERSEGGGENWNMTPMSYDILRRSHKDMFMLLDEAEGTDATGGKRAELAKVVIFGGASGDSKRRYTDTKPIPPLKMTMLSTTNTSIRRVLEKEPPERVEAVASRMMSLRIVSTEVKHGGMPVFSTVPSGFETIGDAVRAMRNAADQHYGTAGPAFAEAIALAIRADEGAFRSELHDLIEKARTRLSSYVPGSDERHVAFMAVIEATLILAQKFEIFRSDWGQPAQVVERVLLNLQSDSSERIRRVAEMKALFIRYVSRRVKKGKLRPLHPAILPWRFKWMDAKKLPQFMGMCTVGADERRKELFLHPAYFKKTFSLHQDFLQIAKREGWLLTSPSEADRLQKQAPTKLRKFGFRRVYEIDLTRLR